jgi:hypothetical protein
VVSFRPQPPYHQRKNAISVEHEAVYAAQSVWTFRKTNKFSPLSEVDRQFVQLIS